MVNQQLRFPMMKMVKMIKYRLNFINGMKQPCASVKENKRVIEAYGELIGKKVVYTEVTEKRVLNKKLLKK